MQPLFSRRTLLKSSAQLALTAGAAGSLLAACGGSSSGNGPTTITFWHTYNVTGPETETLVKKVIPAFNKKFPNITVKQQQIPYDSMLQKLTASVAGGKGPDVVRADIIWMPQLAKIGALVKMDDMLDKDLFYPGPLQTCIYKGNYYGLPLDTNTRVVIYNKEVLEKAGISSIPTTTADFKAACLKITALGKDFYGYSEGSLDPWITLPWVWCFGGEVTDDAFSKATGYINSANSVAALAYLSDLYHTKAVSPGILGGSNLSPSDALTKGQTGFIIDGPWMPGIFASSAPKLQYDMAVMPAGPNGHTASVVGGEDIAILSSSKNLDAAREFVKFMTSAEAQILMAQVGQMPTLKSVADDSSLPAYLKTFNEQIQFAKPRTVSPNYPKISTILSDAFNKALRNQLTPQAALDQAAQLIDAQLV